LAGDLSARSADLQPISATVRCSVVGQTALHTSDIATVIRFSSIDLYHYTSRGGQQRFVDVEQGTLLFC